MAPGRTNKKMATKPVTNRDQGFANGAKNYWPDWADAFLEALAESCNVTHSCKVAGISRTQAWTWKKANEDFAARWQEAVAIGVVALEDEAKRRAVDGVEEPVYYRGAQVGTIRKYSDLMLIFLLRAHKPEMYRDNVKHQVEGDLHISIDWGRPSISSDVDPIGDEAGENEA